MFKDLVNQYDHTVREWRRHLHQNPELSHKEIHTSAFVCKQLESMGIEHYRTESGYGVIGIINGHLSGATIALRADMDALPIEEKNEVSYRSQTARVMHACGHDAHTAMLLGTASVLQEKKEQVEGKAVLIFQPAEEDAPIGGSEAMMDDPVFLKHKPDVIFGQHVWPDLPVGQFGMMAGPIMGNSDRITIEVNGSGGHASMPHQTVDAIIVANQILSSLQTIVSRNVDPLESAVVTIGTITGGDRYNVIANQVTLEGTVRTFSEDVKQKVKKNLKKISQHVAEGMGATATVHYQDGYPATVNTPEWAAFAEKELIDLYGEQASPHVLPSLGGEDFGRYLLKYPGAYYWLGTAIPERKVQKPLHDPNFDIDEQSLTYGVEFMATLTIQALKHLHKQKGD
ncbi:M20 metallopeptidase family protein [Alkalicoccobacillus murimartini]|uniref:Amidohydrolase n=1 Tax=Alkalicoccobacillus murimartini TaxID=171685 RepID=A0ABT9YCJ4_9BACI|nr:amidohydrolase [Alkalicoccobacillus murimartini]MDQ0205348.1 amidohydrolase [Alkalicoccobacillus murimartini]